MIISLRTGDIVIDYNNQPVKQASDLPYLVSATKVGSKVRIKYMRRTEPYTVDVTIELLANEDQQSKSQLEGRIFSVLGMMVQDLTNKEREQIGIDDRGILVVEVKSGPFEDAGIRPDDIILAFNQQDIRDSNDLKRFLKNIPVDKPVAVLVYRGESFLFLALTLAKKNLAPWLGNINHANHHAQVSSQIHFQTDIFLTPCIFRKNKYHIGLNQWNTMMVLCLSAKLTNKSSR